MLNYLIRKLIPDCENVGDAAVRRRYGSLCGIYGIVLNVLLFGGKFFAGVLTGSLAIRADALNNLADAGSSVITLLGFLLAGKKADPDHPFGHGRVEYLTGLLLSAIIMVTGFELGKSSVEKILHPEAVEVSLLSAGILLAAIAVKLYMSLYNRRIGKKIHSEAMAATAADSLSDTVATAVVLLSMGVAYFFRVNIDGWAGLAVSLFILWSGVGAMKETVSPLLGKAPEKETVQEIEEIVMSFPEVKGIHDLIVHDYGPGRLMISLHAEVDGEQDIYELHDAIDRAEQKLKSEMGCLATIHMDPIEAENSEVAAQRALTAELVQTLDGRFRIHDFRMVPGHTHTNLIFDTLVPMDCPKKDEQVAEEIRSLVHTTWPDRFAVVTIDRDYT